MPFTSPETSAGDPCGCNKAPIILQHDAYLLIWRVQIRQELEKEAREWFFGTFKFQLRESRVTLVIIWPLSYFLQLFEGSTFRSHLGACRSAFVGIQLLQIRPHS